MIILTIRTDKPESEIGLYDDGKEVAYVTWQAHRELAETIHTKIKEILDSKKLKYEDLSGIVVYKGPGSFTGLRIGISVANALADSLDIPIAGRTDDDWINQGVRSLQEQPQKLPIVPKYGAPVFTTKPRK